LPQGKQKSSQKLTLFISVWKFRRGGDLRTEMAQNEAGSGLQKN
jgi:hypothetical protein